MLKNEIKSIWNRVGVTVLTAPVIEHDVMFTLFGVYSFGGFFDSYKTFEGVWGGEGKALYLATRISYTFRAPGFFYTQFSKINFFTLKDFNLQRILSNLLAESKRTIIK
jgi:hypothetical protein